MTLWVDFKLKPKKLSLTGYSENRFKIVVTTLYR